MATCGNKKKKHSSLLIITGPFYISAKLSFRLWQEHNHGHTISYPAFNPLRMCACMCACQYNLIDRTVMEISIICVRGKGVQYWPVVALKTFYATHTSLFASRNSYRFMGSLVRLSAQQPHNDRKRTNLA